MCECPPLSSTRGARPLAGVPRMWQIWGAGSYSFLEPAPFFFPFLAYGFLPAADSGLSVLVGSTGFGLSALGLSCFFGFLGLGRDLPLADLAGCADLAPLVPAP